MVDNQAFYPYWQNQHLIVAGEGDYFLANIGFRGRITNFELLLDCAADIDRLKSRPRSDLLAKLIKILNNHCRKRLVAEVEVDGAIYAAYAQFRLVQPTTFVTMSSGLQERTGRFDTLYTLLKIAKGANTLEHRPFHKMYDNLLGEITKSCEVNQNLLW